MGCHEIISIYCQVIKMLNSHDFHFPLIHYKKNKSNKEWGQAHGEELRVAISELYEIRKELLLSKSPHLKSKLKEYGLLQFSKTQKMSANLSDEMMGIASGSNLTIHDIVLINNYTDFRDIGETQDEGCSTVHIQKKNNVLSGQTWDMHQTAKNYLVLLHVPESENGPESVILTLSGCLGLMGINNKSLFVGVNNINTKDAQNGIVWPALVRQALIQENLDEMRKTLWNAEVTSGHNYLISDYKSGEHHEITPKIKEMVSRLSPKEEGAIYHTNHCLGPKVLLLEDKNALSSTTHCRFDLLKKNIDSVIDSKTFYQLLTSHEEYPKSICSHFMAKAIDPSMTCGGGIVDFSHSEMKFWRGCPHLDKNYKEYNFKLIDNHFIGYL